MVWFGQGAIGDFDHLDHFFGKVVFAYIANKIKGLP